MPRKVETFRPSWMGAKKADVNRPNSYQRGYGGRSWAATRRQVIVRDASTCQLCGKIISGPVHVDHIIAKADGGTDALENLRCLHPHCHSKVTAEWKKGRR